MALNFIMPALKHFLPRPTLLLRLFFGIWIPLLLAGEIAEDLLENQGFAFEQPLMLWLHHHVSTPFVKASVALHYIGQWPVAICLAAALAWQQYRQGRRSWTMFVLLSTALSTLITASAKLFFNRTRPELWPRIIEESSASFPSGHSTFAAALATLLILVYWQSPHRHLIAFCAILFAFSMGISRMILGVHYPTDVLVGWITGMTTVLGLYTIMRYKLPTR